MGKNLFRTEVIEDIAGTAVIGYKNVIANPNLQSNTNFWTASALTLTVTASGIQAEGSGVLYQNLSTDDVISGTAYMARVNVNTVSGTWLALGGTVASGLEASGAYSVTLKTGWNNIQFTAGATHQIQLKTTSEANTDTLVASPIEIRQQEDLCVTGNITNGGSWVYVAPTIRIGRQTGVNGNDILVADFYYSGAWGNIIVLGDPSL